MILYNWTKQLWGDSDGLYKFKTMNFNNKRGFFMKLKAVRIICTLLLASVLSTGIIALPVQNAYAEDNVQIENADEVSSDAVVYSAPVMFLLLK